MQEQGKLWLEKKHLLKRLGNSGDLVMVATSMSATLSTTMSATISTCMTAIMSTSMSATMHIRGKTGILRKLQTGRRRYKWYPNVLQRERRNGQKEDIE